MKISFLALIFFMALNASASTYLKKLISKGFISSCSIFLFTQCENFPVRAIDADTARFSQGLKELQNLDSNWDTIVKGQGDNIRRKLGTKNSNRFNAALLEITAILFKWPPS